MVMRGVNHMLALFVVSAAFIASFASWGPRAQMLTLLFLALYGLLLLWFERERDRRLLVALPVLMLLWTNLHGGWILGLVVLVLTLIGETLNRLTKRDGAFSAADVKALALATLACLLVTVVNPYGLRQALYPLVWVFPSAYSNHIAEWASPDFHVSVMMVFEAMLLLLVLAWSRARAAVSWTWVLLAIVFTYLALSELRNVPTWSIVVSPILGVALQTQLPALKYRRRAVAGRTAAVLNITLLLGCAVFYVAIASHYVTPQAVNADVKQNFPQGAITYLRTHSEPSRVFATYVWGGYLTWNLYPRYRDFIDGRANTVFSSAVLLDYLAAYQGAPSWSTILRRYGVNAVLVEPSAALAQILAHIPTWKLVYHDPGSVLYVRR
jgi:hypothetical protein